MPVPTPDLEPFQDATESGTPAPRVVESTDLLAGRAEIVIRHAGRDYRLRRTRLDKLILTA